MFYSNEVSEFRARGSVVIYMVQEVKLNELRVHFGPKL